MRLDFHHPVAKPNYSDEPHVRRRYLKTGAAGAMVLGEIVTVFGGLIGGRLILEELGIPVSDFICEVALLAIFWWHVRIRQEL